MKKIDPGKSIGVLANLGVLIGILLLVYELNQNRDMMEAQTRFAVSQAIADQLLTVATDGELNEIIHRADSGEPLSEAEAFRYSSYMLARLRYWENTHYQYRIGLYDETEFAGQRALWRRFIGRSQAVQDFWTQYKFSFSPEFVAEIDGLATN